MQTNKNALDLKSLESVGQYLAVVEGLSREYVCVKITWGYLIAPETPCWSWKPYIFSSCCCGGFNMLRRHVQPFLASRKIYIYIYNKTRYGTVYDGIRWYCEDERPKTLCVRRLNQGSSYIKVLAPANAPLPICNPGPAGAAPRKRQFASTSFASAWNEEIPALDHLQFVSLWSAHLRVSSGLTVQLSFVWLDASWCQLLVQ